APKVLARPESADMIELISSAAKQENVDVFHRFALMRHWHDVDGIPFEAFLSPDGLHMNDWSYHCFAKALADAIADAAAPDRESGTDAKAIAEEPTAPAGLRRNPGNLSRGHELAPAITNQTRPISGCKDLLERKTVSPLRTPGLLAKQARPRRLRRRFAARS